MKLQNKTVLVTGGARGIGRAIALEAAKEGADVIIADIAAKDAGEVIDSVRALSRKALFIKTDVSSAIQLKRMADKAVAVFSKIDVLFNNAGIVDIHDFLDITEEEWDKSMAVNARGAFLCAQRVARVMKERGGGVIVSTSSVAAKKGMAQLAAYAASKAVVTSLTWSMAQALAPYGIRVNAIAPGMVETDTWNDMDKKAVRLFGEAPGAIKKRRTQIIPLGRPATAEEVARVAVFLASDEASYIHGQAVNVNGGDLVG